MNNIGETTVKIRRIFSAVIVCCLLAIPFIHQPIDNIVLAATKSETLSRVINRTFPSVFQAWSPVESGPGVSGDKNLDTAKHDLYFTSTQGLGLKWNDSNPDSNEDDGRGKSFTEQSISNAADNVNTLRRINPDLVILTEIRDWCAWSSYLPEDSLWWKYDNYGKKIAAWQDGDNAPFYFLDWNNVEFRKQVAAQCKAVVDTGLVDGIMIDCFTKDRFGDADNDPNRIDLMRRIREAISDDYLILINSNNFIRPNTAQYINGLYMECFNSSTPNDWQGISDTLIWAENNLRYPRINCLEVQFDSSRDEPGKMRAATTLSLVQSNGYVLFADPNGLPRGDHLHDWYSFWDTDLGKPKNITGKQRENDKMWQREFSKGTVIYNPMGNGDRVITFVQERKSTATNTVGKTFIVSDNDGDIFTYIVENQDSMSSSSTSVSGKSAAIESENSESSTELASENAISSLSSSVSNLVVSNISTVHSTSLNTSVSEESPNTKKCEYLIYVIIIVILAASGIIAALIFIRKRNRMANV